MRYNNTLLLDKNYFNKCNHIIKMFEKRFDCKCELLGAIDSFEHSRPDCPLFKVAIDDKFYILNESIHKEDAELRHSLDRFGKYLDMFNDDDFKVYKEIDGEYDTRYRDFIEIRKRLCNKYPIDIQFAKSVRFRKDVSIYKSFIYAIDYNDETYILERKCNTSCAECIYAWLDIMLEGICKDDTKKGNSKFDYEADVIEKQISIYDFI